MAAIVGSHSKLFEHHVEDMRQLTLCKICLKPFYEPFILACGHTYCYGCLSSWFGGGENRRKRKNCPDCRADVITQPAPNYLLRDLVHLFVNRAELLPEDETIEEHNRGKQEEASHLAADRAGRGLFGGIFLKGVRRHAALPLVDYDDHVTRCPTCAWELEDGICLQCGWEQDSFDYADLSGDGLSLMDDESIMSESAHVEGQEGPPRHFYGIGSEGEEYDSETDDYGTPREADQYDENDDFIDNEDYPEEVDDDGIDNHLSDTSATPRTVRIAGHSTNPVHVRISSARSTPSEQWTHYDESDESEEEVYGNVRIRYSRRPVRRSPESASRENSFMSDESITGEEASAGFSSEEDWEDEGGGNNDAGRPSVQNPTRRGRQAVVISDDEEEEQQEEGEEEEEHDDFGQGPSQRLTQNSKRRSLSDMDSGTAFHSDPRLSTIDRNEDVDEESFAGSNSEESDDTILPAQSRNRRQRRLDTHRSRRSQPPSYQSFGRVDVPSRSYSNQQRGFGSARQMNRRVLRRGPTRINVGAS